MEIEQRAAGKRIEVTRLVEAMDANVGLGVQGYTVNLSNGGMRAYLDMAPSPGDLVELHIALSDESPPVHTEGEVVWSVPEENGCGAEVGLRFVDAGAPKNRPGKDRDAAREDRRTAPAGLSPGTEITISAEGRTIRAVVREAASDGSLRIAVLANADTDREDEDASIDEADLFPQAVPFRAAKEAISKWAGLLFALTVSVCKAAVRFSSFLIHKLRRSPYWRELLEKARSRPPTLAARPPADSGSHRQRPRPF